MSVTRHQEILLLLFKSLLPGNSSKPQSRRKERRVSYILTHFVYYMTIIQTEEKAAALSLQFEKFLTNV